MQSLKLLLRQLQSRLSFGGNGLTWFRSYLTDHSQNVMIGDSLSSLVWLLFGITEGSVFWSMLFSIYIPPIKGYHSSL